MPVLDYAIKKSILTVTPEVDVQDIIKLMAKSKGAIDHQSRDGINSIIQYQDCVFVTLNSQVVGIFTIYDVTSLLASGMNFANVKIADVMREPVITLAESEAADINAVSLLMRSSGISYLPIVDTSGKVIGIITPESIAVALQIEVRQTKELLQKEITQRCCLELELEQKVIERTEDLIKTNKQLQRSICDRIATEAQLLQTTSELQEIFQAFPDIYFRLASDGTILSYHASDMADFYFSATTIHQEKCIQDILPTDIACEFQKAILKVHHTNSLVAIEYDLQISGENKSFEARFLASITNQIIVIIRNITERKKAQDGLQKAIVETRNFASLLESRVEERTYELRNTNERLLKEIIERQRIEEALRYRVEFEKLITTISTQFINLATNEIDDGINQAIKAIAEFVNVEHSYVFLFAKSQIKYEWYSPKITAQIYSNTEITEIILPWIKSKLQHFETIYIPNVNELPPEAAVQKQALTLQSIKSLVILPIVCSGLLIGYLSFNTIKNIKNWNEDSISLLKIVGEMLGHALERQRVEQALRISEDRYARAISAGKVGIWEWNIEKGEFYVDNNLKAMLGYDEDEINNKFNNKFDDWLKFVHPDDIESVKVEANAYLEGLIPKYEIEHRMLHKNGTPLWFLARGVVISDKISTRSPYIIAGSNTDITARKLAENQLKSSLKEKEVLLKEIHHRVKNNLQVISSLLRLQAGYIKDEQALDIFKDSQNRVRAMAMIHENLYQSTDLARIEFSDYIRNLTNNLIRCYSINRDINIKLNIDRVLLRIDTAIPCGLIINELVSNSLKHGFNENQTGEISIEFLELSQGEYSLSVTDNGIGFTEDIELPKKHSLGLQLVWNLVEQLEGNIEYKGKLGTKFNITFTQTH